MLEFPNIRPNPEKNDVTKRPYSPGNEPANGFVCADLKTYAQRRQEEQERLSLLKDKEREALEAKKLSQGRTDSARAFLLQQGREMQERFQRGGTLLYTYNKAVRDNRPPQEIALLAAKALSLIMSDVLYYKPLAERYRTEYGITLQDAQPFEVIRSDPKK